MPNFTSFGQLANGQEFRWSGNWAGQSAKSFGHFANSFSDSIKSNNLCLAKLTGHVSGGHATCEESPRSHDGNLGPKAQLNLFAGHKVCWFFHLPDPKALQCEINKCLPLEERPLGKLPAIGECLRMKMCVAFDLASASYLYTIENIKNYKIMKKIFV